MSFSQRVAFQNALVAKLRADVAANAAADGSDIPVRDRVMHSPPALHIRVDGFNLVRGNRKNDKSGTVYFFVHVFAQPGETAGAASVGAEATRIQGAVIAALDDWAALPGSGKVEHQNSSDGAGDDPAKHHAISRFSIYLGG